MKPIHAGVVGAAMLALTTLSAQADCAADLAAMTEGTGHAQGHDAAAHDGGISKDGTLAPLESPAEAAASSAAPAAGSGMASAPDAGGNEGNGGIAKDGSHAPLEGAGGPQPGVAMSGADAQAQQEGKPTAAEAAAGATAETAGGSDRDTHLREARKALDAGDEAACMKHLEEAKAASS